MIRVDDDAARGVRTVTLDRPERRNAMTTAMLDDLAAAVETSLAVVCLRGAGSAFSAGAELDEVASLADDGGDPAAFARRGQETMRAVETAPAVVVASVDAPARGGGAELALAADI